MRLKNKFWLFSTVSSLIPLIVLAVTAYFTGIGITKSNSENHAAEIIKQSENAINLTMDSAVQQVKLLAKIIEKDGPETAQKYFFEAKNGNPSFTSIYFGEGKTGKMYRTSTKELPDGYDPKKRPWYGAALGKEYGITEPYVDATTKKMVITICSEVKRDGESYGVVGIDFMLDQMSETMNKIKIGKAGYLAVLTESGVCLIHPKQEMVGENAAEKYEFIKEIVEKKNGITRYKFNGVKKIAVYSQSEMMKWIIMGTLDEKELSSGFTKMAVIILLFTIIIGSTIFVFVKLFNNKLTGDLDKLI